MIKVLQTQLPNLLALPAYTADEQTMLQEVSNLIFKQAEQLKADAKMITKVTLG